MASCTKDKRRTPAIPRTTSGCALAVANSSTPAPASLKVGLGNPDERGDAVKKAISPTKRLNMEADYVQSRCTGLASLGDDVVQLFREEVRMEASRLSDSELRKAIRATECEKLRDMSSVIGFLAVCVILVFVAL